MQFPFLTDDQSLREQVAVLKTEYINLYKRYDSEKSDWKMREERGMNLIKRCQEENIKKDETNKLGMNLVQNLRKQIEKYQNDNIFIDEKAEVVWKQRYDVEKRTSEYLRAECEDLQNEIENLNENTESNIKNAITIANEVWQEEVEQVLDNSDYKDLYSEAVTSKLQLLRESSKEIQRLRDEIKKHMTYQKNYNHLLDRVVRYHGLEGQEDVLFQLITNAGLQEK